MIPKVHVNCACSLDGKIAGIERKQVRISDEEDMARVHHLRAENDGILVGVGTILSDDPKLTVKKKYVDFNDQPASIIIDPSCRCPENALALQKKTFIVTDLENVSGSRFGNDVRLVGTTRENNYLVLKTAFEELYSLGMKKILAEGGGETIFGLFREGLVSSMSVFVSPMVMGGRTAPTVCDGEGFIGDDSFPRGSLAKVERTGEGMVVHYEF